MLVKATITPKIIAWFIPMVLVPCHISVLRYLYENLKPPIDYIGCDCSCWDTIFKGPYEHPPVDYKHFYFNATINSAKIWILIVCGIIALYECVVYLLRLLLKKKLRYSMVLLFYMSIFPHYYSWWAYINYYNDEFYSQWNHQLFFTVTEIISTMIVLHLANTRRRLDFNKLFIIALISVIHIIVGSVDQFFHNILRVKGKKHQVIRDLGLMIPDIFHLIIPCYHMTEKDQHKIKFIFFSFLIVSLIYIYLNGAILFSK